MCHGGEGGTIETNVQYKMQQKTFLSGAHSGGPGFVRAESKGRGMDVQGVFSTRGSDEARPSPGRFLKPATSN